MEISNTIKYTKDTRTEINGVKAKEFYRTLKLKGAIRVDYFLKEDDLYILEVNTIPGFSAESILPQEAKAHGFTLETFLAL